MKGQNKIKIREKTETILSYVAIGAIILVSVLIVAIVVLGLIWLFKTVLNGVLYA